MLNQALSRCLTFAVSPPLFLHRPQPTMVFLIQNTHTLSILRCLKTRPPHPASPQWFRYSRRVFCYPTARSTHTVPLQLVVPHAPHYPPPTIRNRYCPERRWCSYLSLGTDDRRHRTNRAPRSAGIQEMLWLRLAIPSRRLLFFVVSTFGVLIVQFLNLKA